jgi:membrane-associated protease RseP (regulator of RpoE activity)
MAGLLFGLTLLSCLFAGAQMVEGLAAVNWNLLDGGHIVYALLGERWSRIILWVVLAVLAALAFLWQGWILWVALIFIFGRMRVAPLDDVTPLTTGQRALALLMLAIFIMIFTPIPMQIVGA